MHTLHILGVLLTCEMLGSMRLSAEQYGGVEFGEERKEDIFSIQWPQLAVSLSEQEP